MVRPLKSAIFLSALFSGVILSTPVSVHAQRPNVRDQYNAFEYMIPMRDGTKLFTVVWVPKTATANAPILMERTPYGAGSATTGPRRTTKPLMDAGYIFAYQDVRGKGKSEGDYENVRPPKKGKITFDESTDCYDTCDFLVKTVPHNNGNIGLWGISYPGFYAGASAINTHPALKAVSPQAPVSDWFLGDDVHHNGAFFLQETFDFCVGFDVPRGGTRPVIDRQGKSAYQFYLDAGALSNFDGKFLKGLIPYWNTDLMAHGTYDAYWKERALPRNFKNIKCAVLTVGGMFDKEDMWGAQNLYKYGERQNKTDNFIVMGPWLHGGWAGGTGASLGEIPFYSNTGDYYREKIELPFFEKYLNNKNIAKPSEATVFETGTNTWHTFETWPPKNIQPYPLWLNKGGQLLGSSQAEVTEATYVNDPKNPTPYVFDWETSKRAPGDWLIWDQRYFQTRKDVLTYTLPGKFTEELRLAGPITVDFWIKASTTDCDLVVKVIDVYPSDSKEFSAKDPTKSLANFQMMVRSDIMRVKFRDSFENPKAIKPGEPTHVKFNLNDVLHTFKEGHTMMIQVQSSWFPIADQNPNKFMDIYKATDADFQKADISVLSGGKYSSKIILHALPSSN